MNFYKPSNWFLFCLNCLFYLALCPSANADWLIETVDSAGDVGYFSSLALDSSNSPHIGYFDETNDDLKYAYYDYSDGNWYIEIVDSAGDVGLGSSLAIDSGGKPHLSYYDQTKFELKYAYYDGSWNIRLVDNGNGEGFFGGRSSLELDSDDNPHIAYTKSISDGAAYKTELKYALSVNQGYNWNDWTVDTAEDLGEACLALDNQNNPHISYYKTFSGPGTDDYGNPITIYRKDLYYAYAPSRGNWDDKTNNVVDAGGNLGLYNSIAVDSDTNPRISYYDIENGNLIFVNLLPFGWSAAQLVDSAGYVGLYSSLALDNSDKPHISYYDETSGHLKYAYQPDNWSWVIETVDSDGNVGLYTSLALDADGKPHISYYDKSTKGLKYATQTTAFNNTPPTAFFSVSPAGGDTSTIFTVSASGSSDAEDDPAGLEVRWDWEGDGMWDTAFSTAKTTSHRYLAGGIYTIKIEVKDSGGLTDTASLQVQVNTPPSAFFSVNPLSGDTATTFTVDASGSSDAEDDPAALEVRWDWEGDGMWDTAFSTDKSSSHNFSSGGTFNITLEVMDSKGLTDTASRQVSVNSSPTAIFTVTPSSGYTSTTFSADASGSFDAEDDTALLQVRWDWESDGTWDSAYTTDRTADHSYPSGGTYTITVEVKDISALTDTASQQVMVTVPNTPPTALFSVTPSSGSTSTAFAVNASLTRDTEDPTAILQVRWDWEGDGMWDTAFSAAKTAVHTYPIGGIYTITLQVMDSAGLTGTASLQVQVNSPPQALFSIAPSSGDTSTLFAADASGSSDAQDDPSILKVRWDWQSDGTWDTVFSTAKTADHTFSDGGIYTITLQVMDSEGLTGTASLQVQVNSPPQALFSITPSSGDTSTTFTVNAGSSSDAEDISGILQVRWDWEGDGMWDTAFSTAKTADHTFSDGGIYIITLQVMDSEGLTGTASLQVQVNSPPQALFSITPPAGDTSTLFTADASGSVDAQDDTSLLKVRWDWQSDGTWDTVFSTDKISTRSFSAAGIYAVSLQVLDSEGLIDTAAPQEVIVKEPGSSSNTPPVSSFTVNPTSGDLTTEFFVDASESGDAEDITDNLKVRWDWEGDGMWNTSFSTDKTESYTYPAGGTYTILLDVMDSEGLTDTTSLQVQVNSPPEALFSITPPSGDTSTLFTADASGVSDVQDDTSILKVRWDWESDGIWNTSFSTEKTADYTYPAGGTYTIMLAVMDSAGLTDTASQQVQVNSPPATFFTISPSSGDTTTLFTADASNVNDAQDDPSLLKVRWDWEGDGMWDTAFSTAKTADHTFSDGGIYIITLQVMDSEGLTGTASLQVQVNSPPQALFSITPSSGDTSTLFTIDASGSSDAQDDTSLLKVRWDWEDDGTWDTGFSTDKTAVHTYPAGGTYTIVLEVQDTGNLSNTAQQELTVTLPNRPPTAAFTVTPLSGDTSTTFNVNAAGSRDAEGGADNLQVRWDWEGDGMWDTAFSTGKTAVHSYPAGGSFTIVLEVIDGRGLTNTLQQGIQVKSAPTAAFTVTPSSGNTATAFTVNASASRDTEDGTDNLKVRWDWQSDGTWDSEFSTVKTATHSYSSAGTYSITLEITDSDELSDTAAQQVRVVESAGDAVSEGGGGSGGDQPVNTTTVLDTSTTTTIIAADDNSTVSTSTTSIVPSPPSDGGDCLAAPFTATPASGRAPLIVKFDCRAGGTASGYFWDFGDGSFSQAQNPGHTYKEPGSYTVILRVDGAECIKNNLIMVAIDKRCPIERSLSGRPHEKENIALLRRLRDDVFAADPVGVLMIYLYYNHTRETEEILARDSKLKSLVGELVEKHIPGVRKILSDKHLVLTRVELVRIEAALNQIAKHGSPSLKATIQFILKWIKKDSFLNQFGVQLMD